MLKNISSRGFDPKKDIEPRLFEHTLSALNKAVDGAFGKVDYDDDNFAFVSELKYNNAVFSAFKTHRQQNELHAQMWNEKGRVRSFAEFRRAAEPIIGEYNVNWLQTEYNTASIRAQFAEEWKRMDTERDLYPNLQWLPSTSVNPRKEHEALYYKVFAFDDPFLKSNYPGSRWGCKCGITNTSEPVTDAPERKEAISDVPKAAPGLDQNPAISGALFSVSHPYFALGVFAYKKLKPIVEKWIDSYYKSKPPKYNAYKKVAKGVYVSPMHGDKELGKNILAAEELQRYKKRAVYLLPELDPSNKEQNKMRKSLLPEGVYEGKNPDAFSDGKIWEFKTLVNDVSKTSLQRNIRDISKQAPNGVIICNGKMGKSEILSILTGQALQHKKLNEVVLVYNGKRLIFQRRS